jgi:hypothetical protein
LFGIALLLFLEDFAAEDLAAVRVTLTDARERLLVALRLAEDAFFADLFLDAADFEELDFTTDALDALFLRVFCDTACAWNCHAPVKRLLWREPEALRNKAVPRFQRLCAHNSTFPAKINDLCRIVAVVRRSQPEHCEYG